MNLIFIDSIWFTFMLLPFLIFIARIADVTLDTLRIVFITKGNKIIAPILGFFQILIWLVAITRIMKDLDNITYYLAYAGGFATGNYIGLILEEKFALGIQMIRIVTQKDASSLISNLYEKGLHSTSVEAKSNQGKVHVIYLIVQRKMIQNIISLTNQYNPNAFYSIEDIRSVDVQSERINTKQKKYRHVGSEK
ncbi:DUF2179 domain-containing protein [Maribellus comscasis]|uniref:UPF0316 protein GM418_21250 n=1 Tax=Maribellus comscasis TaxID=2681766 RepID=A0A6I6JU96_9BACT|nr:DUF5698 domain-containing protein [Maribellus comscasis]QGY46101.1 DUF2179 domain-containing protein [Maribellus comscasis]